MKFFLLDRVLELTTNKDIVGIKAWSLDNEIFFDHFPGYPIVPGVLLTESMAQLLGLLIENSYYNDFGQDQKVYPILSIIQKAKFRDLVLPGDQCLIKAELINIDTNRANGKATIEIDGKKVAEAILSFSIATEKDIPTSKHIGRREEYVDILLAKTIFKS